MARTAGLVPAVFLAAALALPVACAAQSVSAQAATTQAGTGTQNFPALVQALAPQLVNFAGSPANFQNLVNGLAQGTAVTLVGVTPDGFEQTVSFTPSGAIATPQIAQTLELARQQLIARGVAAPSPEQLGVALVGGQLATPTGTVALPGVVASSKATVSASAGASAPASASPALPNAAADMGNLPAPTHTSDSPFAGNTSDSPLPPTAVPSAASTTGVVSPGAVTNTSPAARMQNRR